MRLLTCIAGIAIMAVACNQKPSSEKNSPRPVPDALAENVKGKVAQIETNTYLVDSTTGAKGKLESKSIEKFDDSGYTVYYSNFTSKDSATNVTDYTHDANGFVTDITTTKNGNPLSSMKIMVDSMGKYTVATLFDSTGKEDVFYDDITSNDFAQVLGAKGHHPDSTLKMTFTNNFDSIYYVGGESKDSVGKLTYSSTIKLNDKKDPEQMDESSVAKDSTTKTTTTYAYNTWDNSGNWTQQTVTENSKPKKIIERIITYKP
ncbi:MAG: hypothetical protein ABJA35_03275 [Parafilimonas sp.]